MSSKDNIYVQALEEVRGGWAKKGKSYKGIYKKTIYTEREHNGEGQAIDVWEQGCHS